MRNPSGARGAVVVLGLDPEGASLPFVDLAVALAGASRRRLVLVSAVAPEPASDATAGRVPLPERRASQHAARALARAQNRARSEGADAASYLSVDSPVAALLSSVRSTDLLVLGRGPGDLGASTRLGSVARAILATAPCDLVLVPRDSGGADRTSPDLVAREVVDALAAAECADGPWAVLDAYAEPLRVRCLGCETWSSPPSRFDFLLSRASLSTTSSTS